MRMSRVHDAASVVCHHFSGSGGLVDGLRPYTGTIDPRALKDVLVAVRTLKDEAEGGEAIPTSALSWIFDLTNTVRLWALDKDSMLVRNKLIGPSEWQTLMEWVVDVELEYR